MAQVAEHYQKVLAPVYSWMLGGFENALETNRKFFQQLYQQQDQPLDQQQSIQPNASGLAIDLGAGCGFQSIVLAELGYQVSAIDFDQSLLDELKRHSRDLPIKPICDNLLNFDQYLDEQVELIICMTDTLLHLESPQQVIELFAKAYHSLEEKGQLLLTFRDLSGELKDLDRLIPVKSDDKTIFTCFLEYEETTVKVHDLVYQKTDEPASPNPWELKKSYYRKLRLSKNWVEEQLKICGFEKIQSTQSNGMITLIASG